MSKPRPNIGQIKCPISGDMVPVRRKTDGTLYFNSPMVGGPVFCSGPGGQDWIMDNAVLFGPDGQPVKAHPIEPISATDGPAHEQTTATHENSEGGPPQPPGQAKPIGDPSEPKKKKKKKNKAGFFDFLEDEG